MTNKPNIGKIALVVFLTVLIWVWSDLAQDDKTTITGKVRISMAPSANPASWTLFRKDENSPAKSVVLLDRVDVKGPAKKVAEISRLRDMGKLDPDLALYLDPKQKGLESEGSHPFDVLQFLKQNDQMKRVLGGLTVEDCEPSKLTVEVKSLEEKLVHVQCVDANDHVLGMAKIDPPMVRVPVPKDYASDAKIRLSADEQQRAKVFALQKIPFVELASGQVSNALLPVSVSLPSQEIALTEYPVQVTLGICFSKNLQGKYQVKLENEATFATVSILATPAAEQEFKDQPFHVVLYLDDDDPQKTPPIEREVSLLLPPDYAQRGEIKASRPLDKAKFRLIPVTPDARPAAPGIGG